MEFWNDASHIRYFQIPGINTLMFTKGASNDTSQYYFGANTNIDNTNQFLRFWYRSRYSGGSWVVANGSDYNFPLTPAANYCWADGSNGAKYVRIICVPHKIQVPTVSSHSYDEDKAPLGLSKDGKTVTVNYTGASQEMRFDLRPNEGINLSVTSGASVSSTANTDATDWTRQWWAYATNPGTYTLTFNLTDTDRYVWVNDEGEPVDVTGKANQTYTFIIRAQEIKYAYNLLNFGTDANRTDGTSKAETLVLENGNQATRRYDMEYSPVYTYYALAGDMDFSHVSYSISNTSRVYSARYNANTRRYEFIMSTTEISNYTITMTPQGGYVWDDGTGTEAKVLRINVKPKKISGDHELIYYGTDSTRSDANKQVVIPKTSTEFTTSVLGYKYSIEYDTAHRYFAVTDFKSGEVDLAVNNASYIVNEGFDTNQNYAKFRIVGNVDTGTWEYRITPGAYYVWDDNETREMRKVIIEVKKKNVKVPVLHTNASIYGSDSGVVLDSSSAIKSATYEYNKTARYIYIDNFSDTSIVTYSATNSPSVNHNAANGDKTTQGMWAFYAINAATYQITFSLALPARYQWEDTAEGGATTRVFRLIINKKIINNSNHTLYYWGNTAGIDYGAPGTRTEIYKDVDYQPLQDVAVEYGTARFFTFVWTGFYDEDTKEHTVSPIVNNDTYGYNTDVFKYHVNTATVDGSYAMGFYLDNPGSWRSYAMVKQYFGFYLQPTANYCWDNAYTSEARLTRVKINPKQIDVPSYASISGDTTDKDGQVVNNLGAKWDDGAKTATFEYSGDAKELILNDFSNGIISVSTDSGSSGAYISQSKQYRFYATNAGTYKLTLNLTGDNSEFYRWKDPTQLTGARIYNIVITRKKIDIPQLRYTGDSYGTAPVTDGVTFSNQVTVNDRLISYNAAVNFRSDGKHHYFNFIEALSTQITVSMTTTNSLSASFTWDAAMKGYKGYINQTSGGLTGDAVFTLAPNANHQWNIDDGSATANRVYTITVNGMKVAVPKFTDADAGSNGFRKTVEYNGKPQTGELMPSASYWFTTAITGASGATQAWNDGAQSWKITATNAGEYVITLSLRANMEWDDTANVKATRQYVFKIRRQKVVKPIIGYYGIDTSGGFDVKDENKQSTSIGDNTYINVDFKALGTGAYHYFALLPNPNVETGVTAVNSLYYSLAAVENSNWEYVWGVDNDNSNWKFRLRQYDYAYITRDVGWSYNLTLNNNYCWDDGTDSTAENIDVLNYRVIVNKLEVKLPTLFDDCEDGQRLDQNAKYAVFKNENIPISFLDYDSTVMSASASGLGAPSQATQITKTEGEGDEAHTVTYNVYRWTAKNANTYTITFSLTNSSVMRWEHNNPNPSFTFTITRAPMVIPDIYRVKDNSNVTDSSDPDFVNQSTREANVVYSTSQVYNFTLENYNTNTDVYTVSLSHSGVFTTGSTGTNYNFSVNVGVGVGTYSVSLVLKANYAWSDGSTDNKVYKVNVTPIIVPLPKIYDAVNGQISASNELSTFYDGKDQYMTVVPNVSSSPNNNNYLNFTSSALRVYRININSNGIFTPEDTTVNLTVDEGMATERNVSTGAIRIKENAVYNNGSATNNRWYYYFYLKDGNYRWEDGRGYDQYSMLYFNLQRKELPKLELYYKDASDTFVKCDNNVLNWEYSRLQRQFYLVMPKGTAATLNDYTVVKSSSYFPTNSQTTVTIDGTDYDAYIVTMSAFAPSQRYLDVRGLDGLTGNYRWQGEVNANTISYEVNVSKKRLATPELYFVSSEEVEQEGGGTVKVEKDVLVTPSMNSTDYTGLWQFVRFKNVDTNEVSINNISGKVGFNYSSSIGAVWEAGNTVMKAGMRDSYEYWANVSLKNTNLYEWADGRTSIDFSFTVNPMKIGKPLFYYIDGTDKAPTDSDKIHLINGVDYEDAEYNAQYQYVRIEALEFGSITAAATAGCDVESDHWNAQDKYYSFRASKAGTYTITISLATNYCWENGSRDPQPYKYTINKKQITVPSFDTDKLLDGSGNAMPYDITGDILTLTYTGTALPVYLKDYDETYMQRSYVERGYGDNYAWGGYGWSGNGNVDASAKTYQFVNQINAYTADGTLPRLFVRLKDTANYCWIGGATEQKVYKLHTNRQEVARPDFYVLTKGGTADDGSTIPDQISQSGITNGVYTGTYNPGDPANGKLAGIDFRITDVSEDQVVISVPTRRYWDNANAAMPTTTWNKTAGSSDINIPHAGTYIIQVSVKNTSNFKWVGTEDATAVQFTAQIDRNVLPLPTIEGVPVGEFTKSVTHISKRDVNSGAASSQAQSMTILNFDKTISRTSMNNKFTESVPKDEDDNEYTDRKTYSGPIDVGSYAVELQLTVNGFYYYDYVFTNGAAKQTYTLTITPKPIAVPTILTNDKLNDGGLFDGATKTVVYSPTGRSMLVDGYDADEMTLSWNGTARGTENVEDNTYLKLTTTGGVTRYTATFSLTNNFSWITTGGVDRDNKSLFLDVTRKAVDFPTSYTVLDGSNTPTTNVTRDLLDLYFEYKETDGTSVDQGFSVNFDETELTTYTAAITAHNPEPDTPNTHSYTYSQVNTRGNVYVRFQLKNGNFRWSDNSDATYRYIYLTITPQPIVTPVLVTDKMGDTYIDSTVSYTETVKTIDFNREDRYILIDNFNASTMAFTLPSGMKDATSELTKKPSGEEGDEGESGGTTVAPNNKILLKATNAGTYNISISFTGSNKANFKWSNGKPGSESIVISLVVNKKKITAPSLAGDGTVTDNQMLYTYNGDKRTMTLTPWDNNELVVIDKDTALSQETSSETNANNIFSATNMKETQWSVHNGSAWQGGYGYWVRIGLKDTANYQWNDSSTAYRIYTLRIQPLAVALPKIIEDEDSSTATYDHTAGTKTVTFTGQAKTLKVQLTHNQAIISNAGAFTLVDDSEAATSNTVIYSGLNAGTYTMTFALANANYKWADDVRYNNTKTLRLIINAMSVNVPTIKTNDEDKAFVIGNTKAVEFTGGEQHMDVNAAFEYLNVSYPNGAIQRETDEEWKEDNVLNVWNTNVGTYTLRFTLKNTTNYRWNDMTASNTYKDIVLKIDVKRLTIPLIDGNGTNTLKTVQFSPDENGGGETQYMYLTNIVDDTIIWVRSATTNYAYGSERYSLAYSYDKENQRYVCSASKVFWTGGVSNYAITLALKDSNYRWEDSTTSDKTYYFRIDRLAVNMPTFSTVTKDVDDDGNEVEKLDAVAGGKATFEFDGEMKNLRFGGVEKNIMTYALNSVGNETATSGYRNGDMTAIYSPDDAILNISASRVFLNTDTTIDYAITFNLTNTYNYTWNDGGSTGNKIYYVRINRKQIDIPRIEGNITSNIYLLEVPFDNTPKSITLNGVDQKYITATSLNPTLFTLEYQDGNKLVGNAEKEVRDNQLDLNLKDRLNTTWTSTSYDLGYKRYTLRVQIKYLTVPSVVGSNQKQYTGNDYTIQYKDVYEDYFTFTPSNSIVKLSYDDTTHVLTATVPYNAPITSYYVTFAHRNTSNSRWANISYNWYNQNIYFYLQRAQVLNPNIKGQGAVNKKTTYYTGAAQDLEIENYLPDLNADGTPTWMTYTFLYNSKFDGNKGNYDSDDKVMTFSATNVGTYTVRISTNAYCTFQDNSTYKDFVLEINKKVYESPSFENTGDGVTTSSTQTFTFNFEEQEVLLKNIPNDKDDATQDIYWYDVTGYAQGTGEDHRLKITWDEDNQCAKVSAKYVGTYTIRFQISNTMFANARWSTTTYQTIDYRVIVNRAVVPYPTQTKTGLGPNDSIGYYDRYKYTVYTGGFLYQIITNVDDTYMTYEDITNYTGVDDDHKMQMTYDKATKSLTCKVKYARPDDSYPYVVRILLKDSANSYVNGWNGWATMPYYPLDYRLYVRRAVHTYPIVASGTSSSMIYTGQPIDFTLKNVVKGMDKYEVKVLDGTGKMTETSWSEDSDGTLVLSATEVGTYQVTVSVIDRDNSQWNAYNWSRVFTFYVTKKPLSANITYSSTDPDINAMLKTGTTTWSSGMPIYVNTNITGMNAGEKETAGIRVYYYNQNNSGATTDLKEQGSGRYPLPTNLSKGTYVVIVTHSATPDNYTIGTYSSKFVINSDPAGFQASDLVWQYKVGSGTAPANEISGNHASAGSAFEVAYQGDALNFGITLNDDQLKRLGVRIVSYSGDTSATNCGNYNVSVTLAAAGTTVYFPTTTYTLYYRIVKAKFDMSGVVWDYNSPFVYDGTAKEVNILGSSLPDGLTVESYTGNTYTNASEGSNSGKYTATVKYTVSNANYVVPQQSDPTSYTGTPVWTCDWVIEKAPILAQWKPIVQVDDENRIFNIPILVTDSEKVRYTYFHREGTEEAGYTWQQIPKVGYSESEQFYKVLPTLTDGSNGTTNYSINYKLVPSEDAPELEHPFSVKGSQIAVTLEFMLDGVVGEEFKYTSREFTGSVRIDAANEKMVQLVGTPTITYEKQSGGNWVAHSGNPKDLGRYKATIRAKYKVLSQAGAAESTVDTTQTAEFTIVKGDIKISGDGWKLGWTIERGGVTYHYDATQGKWLDAYNKEISGFVYDWNNYELKLDGQTAFENQAASGELTITNISGNVGKDAGKYNAQFILNYDSNKWNDPDFMGINSLDWSIAKHQIVLDSAKWVDQDGNDVANFVFSYDLTDGAKVYTVTATGLPKELTDLVTAGNATITYNNNSFNKAGNYKAVLTVTFVGSDYIKNYEIIYPDSFSNELSWTIEKRELIAPDFLGRFSEFDFNEHEVVQYILGGDSDWKNYYTISSAKYEMSGTDINYQGIGGDQNKLINAGTYKYTFKLNESLVNDGNITWLGGGKTDVTATFTINKLGIIVIGWNGNFENSTVMTDHDSMLAADTLNYTFQRKDKDESSSDADAYKLTPITLEQLKKLGGGKTVVVTPNVATVYAGNVDMTFLSSDLSTYEYVTRYDGLEWLDKPKFDVDSLVFDGTAHTFTITDWDTKYSKYIELITDDETGVKTLTQTKAGNYVAKFKFKTDAQASWKTSDGMIDQSDIEVFFEIQTKYVTVPTAKDYDFSGVTIDGTADFDAADKDFYDITGTSSARDVNKYTMKLTLKDTESCMWSNNTTDDITIEWNINTKVLPTANTGAWTSFDGKQFHNLVEDCGYDADMQKFFNVKVEYSEDGSEENYADFGGYDSSSIYSAYKPGGYRLTFSLKSDLLGEKKNNVTWSSGLTDDQVVIMSVTKHIVTVIGWNKNGTQSTVRLVGGATPNSDFFEYVIKDEDGARVDEATVLSSGVGKIFTIELAVKTQYTDYVGISYVSADLEKYAFVTETIKISKPTLLFDTYDFDTTEHTFVIKDWDNYKKYLEIDDTSSELKQTNAGNYSVTLRFKDNSIASWEDGTTGNLILTFKINSISIDLPTVSDKGYNGSTIDALGTYLTTYGNYVAVSGDYQAKDAGTYTFTLTLKHDTSTIWTGSDNSAKSFTWNITTSKLTKPADTGSWTTFDANDHDLTLITGVQSDWTSYYSIKVEYSKDGGAYSAFAGNIARNAGYYKVTFHILDALNPDGASNVVWDDDDATKAKQDVEVIINVAKLAVTVTDWTAAGQNSTAVFGTTSLPSSTYTYEFTNSDGTSIDASALASADAGEKFYKKLVLDTAEKDNIDLSYTPGKERYAFVMSIKTLDKPVLDTKTAVFDGNTKTFNIVDFDLYQDFVTVTGDSLKQIDAGTYSVTVKINDPVVFTWTDGTIGDVTLTFTVTKAIISGAWDTSDPKKHTFKEADGTPTGVLNLVYTDSTGAIVVTFVAGETYTATISIASSYTTNYELDSTLATSSTFTIPIEYTEMKVDFEIKDNKKQYNGQEQTFEISKFNLFSDRFDMTGSLSQTDAGKYSVTLSFKADQYYCWGFDDAGNPLRDSKTLNFEITKVEVKGVWKDVNGVPAIDTTATDFDGTLPDLLEYTFRDSAGTVVIVTDPAKDLVKNANYRVNVAIKTSYLTNFFLSGEVQKDFAFFIDDEGNVVEATLTKISVPTIIGGTKTYAGGNSISFVVSNWEINNYAKYLNVLGGLTVNDNGEIIVTDAGDYTLTLSLKPEEFAIWDSGDMDDKTLTFTVGKYELVGSWSIPEGSGTPVFAIDDSLITFDLPDGLITTKILDGEGKVIDPTAMKAGSTYVMAVELTDTDNYAFASTVRDRFNFSIDDNGDPTEVVVRKLAIPTLVENSKVANGSVQTFEILNFDLIKEFVTVEGKLEAKDVGKYSVTIKLNDPLKAVWDNGTVNGATSDFTLTFEITQPSGAIPVDDEFIDIIDKSQAFIDQDITFAIDWPTDFDTTLVEIVGSLTQRYVAKYSVTLHIKDSNYMWKSTGNADLVLNFEITPAEIGGDWVFGSDENEGVPYYEATPSAAFATYPDDLFTYTVKDADGNVITDYSSLVRNKTYYVTATLNNANFVLFDKSRETVAFRFDDSWKSYEVIQQRLPYPTFVNDTVEFDGENHTFVIDNWDNLKDYLTVEGDLTKREVGKYQVRISLVDKTLAIWDNGKAESYMLKFEITVRTTPAIEVDKPTLSEKSKVYTGKPLDFALVDASKYDGIVENIGDSLVQTAAGKYKAVLHLKNTIIYTWADGTTDDIEIEFEVTKAKVSVEWVIEKGKLPFLKKKTSKPATSSAQIAAAEDEETGDEYEGLFEYVISTDRAGNNIVDPESVQPGINYYMSVVILDPNIELDADVQDIFVFRITSDGDMVEVPYMELDDIALVIDQIQYTGNMLTFEIANWEYFEPYVTVEGSLNQREVGKYKVRINIPDPKLAVWASSGNSYFRELEFEVTQDEVIKVHIFDRPTFVVDRKEFTGTDQAFQINNWDNMKDYVQIVEGIGELTKKDPSIYTVTVHIVDTDRAQWSDGTFDDVVLTFRISKLNLDGTWSVLEKIPSLDIDESKLVTELPDNALSRKVYDADGKEVAEDALQENNTYRLVYTVDGQYDSSYALPASLSSIFFKVNKDGTSEIVSGFPAEVEEEGFNMITWLALAATLILTLFLVALIFFVAFTMIRRKKAGEAEAAQEAAMNEAATEETATPEAADNANADAALGSDGEAK